MRSNKPLTCGSRTDRQIKLWYPWCPLSLGLWSAGGACGTHGAGFWLTDGGSYILTSQLCWCFGPPRSAGRTSHGLSCTCDSTSEVEETSINCMWMLAKHLVKQNLITNVLWDTWLWLVNRGILVPKPSELSSFELTCLHVYIIRIHLKIVFLFQSTLPSH